jgi:ABC-type dipeptide/oligopeptide/nickel transport system permease component
MTWPPGSSAGGYVPFAEDPWRALQFIILPVATLVLIEVGVLTRMARAATVDVLRLDYLAHARVKGLSELACSPGTSCRTPSRQRSR